MKDGASVADNFIMTRNRVGESKLEVRKHFPIWPPRSRDGLQGSGHLNFAVFEKDSNAMLLPRNCD
jgi:hypothetical protein